MIKTRRKLEIGKWDLLWIIPQVTIGIGIVIITLYRLGDIIDFWQLSMKAWLWNIVLILIALKYGFDIIGKGEKYYKKMKWVVRSDTKDKHRGNKRTK